MLNIHELVVLAGGDASKFQQDVAFKGLVKVKEKTLLSLILEKYLSMGIFQKVVLTVPAELEPEILAQDKVPPGVVIKQVITDSSVLENLVNGINETNSEYVMVSTVDIPFIKRESIVDVLTQCEEHPADFYYPIMRKEDVTAKYPNFSKTFVTLAEGVFTGGNVFVARREIVFKNKKFIDDLFLIRKSPVRLVQRLGLKFVLKFMAKRLTIEEIENKMSSLMHSKGRAIITSHAEIGIDIDDADDLRELQKIS